MDNFTLAFAFIGLGMMIFATGVYVSAAIHDVRDTLRDIMEVLGESDLDDEEDKP